MLISVMTGLTAIAAVGIITGRRLQMPLPQNIGWPLWGVIGSLLAYNYYALGLPGTDSLAQLHTWAGLVTTLGGGLLGLLLYGWFHRHS
jgi:hypothetical protein